MGWDRDVESLLPTHKHAHPEFVTFGCLPAFFGTEKEAYSFYTGQKYLRFGVRFLVLIVCSFPTIALFTCVAIALLFHFEQATNTHCRVTNVLPSISTVIGGFPETSFIWSLLIYLHFPPRIIPPLAYDKVFSLRIDKRNRLGRLLIKFHLILALVELSSLISLTYYNSNYNHEYHVISFSIFGVSSLLYTLTHLVLFKFTEMNVQSKGHMLSWRQKKRLCAFSVSCLLTCAYLFYRHNEYCEPFVFSIFAFFEYLFVLSNIAFHSTFRHDFADRFMYIS